MQTNVTTYVAVSEDQWNSLNDKLQEILDKLNRSVSTTTVSPIEIRYITALEFMNAVRIKQTKFDQLVQLNKIKIIKKKRKIYLPVSEIDRYFKDASIK